MKVEFGLAAIFLAMAAAALKRINNTESPSDFLKDYAGLDKVRREVLFDPQTSGGLLLAVPPETAPTLLAALLASGHQAAPAEIGIQRTPSTITKKLLSNARYFAKRGNIGRR